MRSLITTSILFVLCGGLAAQNTYFVDAVNGNDTNSGLTRKLAFKTLGAGAAALADNDTLIVLPGTYGPSGSGDTWPVQFGDSAKRSTQNGVRIVGEGGPSVTILDGELTNNGAGKPILRFRWDADGAQITGFTFRNTSSASYWSMGIRLGSTSGANFACRNVEIHGNVFENVHRAAVIFGTNPTASPPNPTAGVKFHDNLIVNASHRPIAVWGGEINYVYNNTIVNPKQAGIWVDSLSTQKPSKAVIVNNIVYGGAVTGIEAGTQGGAATYTHNNAFMNATNYKGATFGNTNISVDPKFVSVTNNDYHLQASSPMLQTGSLSVPVVRHDLDRFPRASDSDKNNVAGIDRGAYQFTDTSMTIGGTWAPGGTGTFTFSGGPTVGAVLLGTKEGALLIQPIGVILIDVTSLIPLALNTTVPGTASLPIPNNPTLLGLNLVSQGAAVGPTRALNSYTRRL